VRAAPLPGRGDDRAPAAVMAALRTALRREIRARSLWENPPSFLGIEGWDSWQQGGMHDGPFAELLADCFSFIFVERLRSLRGQLAFKDNIEGLVILNIRHFLHDRQKAHDPLGYRVFEVAWAAIEQARTAGALHVIGGDPRVRNDTLLSFDPAAAAAPPPPSALRSWAARIDDELLPEVVTASGRRQEQVAAEVASRLTALRHAGVISFRFKELVDELKRDVRERWAAILSGEAGGEITTVPALVDAAWVEAPGASYEARESFRALVSCVLQALAACAVTERTRGHLTTLWQYLRVYSIEGGGEAQVEIAGDTAAGEPATGAPRRRRRGGRPSDRSLADRLHIPREQLPEMFAILAKLVGGCRSGGRRLTLPPAWPAQKESP
jgi:hypothetical protein